MTSNHSAVVSTNNQSIGRKGVTRAGLDAGIPGKATGIGTLFGGKALAYGSGAADGRGLMSFATLSESISGLWLQAGPETTQGRGPTAESSHPRPLGDGEPLSFNLASVSCEELTRPLSTS